MPCRWTTGRMIPSATNSSRPVLVIKKNMIPSGTDNPRSMKVIKAYISNLVRSQLFKVRVELVLES